MGDIMTMGYDSEGRFGTLQIVALPDSDIEIEGRSPVHPDVALVGQTYNRLALNGGWQAFLDGYPDPDPRLAAIDQLEPLLGENPDIVELGCGSGRPVAERLATFADVTAYDLSVAFIEEAQRTIPGPRFEYGDMATLDLPARSVDAVVAFFSIFHLPRQHHFALYKRIHSWLRPRGYATFALGCESEEAAREDDWLGGGPMFWSSHDSATNLRLLREAGFAIASAAVRPLEEPDGPVNFQWVLVQRQYGGV